MIEVRIRHHTEARSVHLCMWPATELDRLIPALNAWGVVHIASAAESGVGAHDVLSGSIQVDTDAAYFEVTIEEG
ncbi:MAG: hypothetical protein ACRDTZ_20480 [Pseudonocardiaceae bacterium]